MFNSSLFESDCKGTLFFFIGQMFCHLFDAIHAFFLKKALFSTRIILVQMLFGDIPLPIGDEQCGERKSHDEAYESQQGSPYRETEQQDSRIQSHGFPHDLWGDDEIGDDLYDDEYQDGFSENEPEILSCIRSFQHSQEGGGNQGESMQIGDEVEDADQDAETDAHGKVDDGESDAEHDAHTKSYHALSADIVIEFPFHVRHQFVPEGPVLLGEYLHPFVGERFVVHQDEEHVQQGNHRCHDADDHACRLAKEVEQFGYRGLQSVAEVLALEESGDGFAVVMQPCLNRGGKVVDMRGVVEIACHHITQFLELLKHRRDDQVEQASQDGTHEDQRDDDGQGSGGDVQPVLYELDDGVEQVGHEPCDEEGQKHTAQIVDDKQYGEDCRRYQKPADELVEGDFLV